MTKGKGSGDRDIVVKCPKCGTIGEFRGEYHRSLVVLCGECMRDLTKEFKQAFYSDVAADLSARRVGRDNRSFLKELEELWPSGGDGGEDGNRDGDRDKDSAE